MLRSFKSKGLSELWSTGSTAKINPSLQRRIIARLDALDAAERPDDMNVPGFDFHALKGFDPTRYTVPVNGPWCLTFGIDGKYATQHDCDQYH